MVHFRIKGRVEHRKEIILGTNHLLFISRRFRRFAQIGYRFRICVNQRDQRENKYSNLFFCFILIIMLT
jgi:hypothetical protein